MNSNFVGSDSFKETLYIFSFKRSQLFLTASLKYCRPLAKLPSILNGSDQLHNFCTCVEVAACKGIKICIFFLSGSSTGGRIESTIDWILFSSNCTKPGRRASSWYFKKTSTLYLTEESYKNKHALSMVMGVSLAAHKAFTMKSQPFTILIKERWKRVDYWRMNCFI